eukprot:TRINITY_DN10365_c0_g1_i1.p1 TRINITY_DN10365_c0_g1~~TRINITY_DN10365_c0_g1_i1.p1  ORF type:complete len:360 (+),score=62.33 TRINITY_DN10365_c0_g1_i1:298-1377(+)
MIMPFYKTLPRNEQDLCTLRLTLRAIHDFLVEPLLAWKVAPSSVGRVKELVDANRELSADRMTTIRKYTAMAKHPELFASPLVWREEWLDPAFRRASQEGTTTAWRALLTEELPGEVFSFPFFTESFCQTLVEEIFGFYASGLPARRPNSMNNYGIVLNDIGLEPLMERLQNALQPLGDLLFPGPGNEWDGQHSFVVRYRGGEDLGLDMHTDDSDVTFNICLGLDFTGAGLQFCGMMGAPNHRRHSYTYQHTKGRCVCHLGRKRHGADNILSGERLNLILWNHSSTYRQSDAYNNTPYHKEDGPPDPTCVSYTHDRDYGNFFEYPVGKEKFRGRGWCPRRKYEYEGFKPDSEIDVVASS